MNGMLKFVILQFSAIPLNQRGYRDAEPYRVTPMCIARRVIALCVVLRFDMHFLVIKHRLRTFLVVMATR